jgi:hypothetical protein
MIQVRKVRTWQWQSCDKKHKKASQTAVENNTGDGCARFRRQRENLRVGGRKIRPEMDENHEKSMKNRRKIVENGRKMDENRRKLRQKSRKLRKN